MNLKEYQGKEIFRKYNINIPDGFLIKDIEDIGKNINKIKSEQFVLKSQILAGGRGKSGGIIFTDKKNIKKSVSSLLGKTIRGFKVEEILAEEKLKIDKEFYLSLTVDRQKKNILLIFSSGGGIDIEELAAKSPEKIIKVFMDDYNKGILKKYIGSLDEIDNVILSLKKIIYDYDAELVEINPLVLANNQLIAADSKIVLDDNALFRHPEFIPLKESQLTDIEKKSAKYGLNYVELDGNIAVIGNGAGLVMATLDMLNYFGGRAANFLDVGGGASIETMEKAIEIAMLKNPKGFFINIFGGITRCDNIANGLVNYLDKNKIKIPIVVRMIGTNEEDGNKILNENGIYTLSSMEEAAEKIVELVKKK